MGEWSQDFQQFSSPGAYMVAANGLYQSVRNYETGNRVIDALLCFDNARFDRVKVVAFCGIVELSGEVASSFDKVLAVGIAERVAGVTTVVESLLVQKSVESRRGGVRREHRSSAVDRRSPEDRVTGRINFVDD